MNTNNLREIVYYVADILFPTKLMMLHLTLGVSESVNMGWVELCGELHISEIDPWTQTPILLDIGTFAIPLSTYTLIKPHIKWVPITISDTDAGIRIGYI